MNYYSHRLLSITDCDVIAIQLPEHIKAHYKTWLDYVNEKASVTLSADLTKRVRDLLSVQIGAPDNIPTTRPQALADTISLSTRVPNMPVGDTTEGWQLDLQVQAGPASDGLQQHTLQYRFADPSQSRMSISKRTASNIEDERNSKKSKRTCTYCHSTECKGRGGQKFCPQKELDDGTNNAGG